MSTKKLPSFLGQGWAFPPTFVRDINSVVLTANDVNIKECLNTLLSTQCGERVMNEKYGTTLRNFAFGDLDGDLYTLITDAIREAILLYEPRIKLDDVLILPETDQDSVLVTVTYV